MANNQAIINKILEKKKREDLAGLMEAWGSGKLQEYLAPELRAAGVEVAAASPGAMADGQVCKVRLCGAIG